MGKSGVYSLTNKVNFKRYVGSAVSLVKRRYEHFSTLEKGIHCNKKLQNAYNKHGAAAFEFEVLKTVEPKFLLVAEQYFIDIFDVVKTGYNLCPIAGSNLGYKHSEETKEKLRIANKGKRPSEECKRKALKACKGKASWNKGIPATEEHRKKLIESIKQRPKPYKHPMQGKKHSAATIEKLRQSHLGHVHTEEQKQKIGQALKGRKISESQKKQLSIKMTGKGNSMYGKIPWNKKVTV